VSELPRSAPRFAARVLERVLREHLPALSSRDRAELVHWLQFRPRSELVHVGVVVRPERVGARRYQLTRRSYLHTAAELLDAAEEEQRRAAKVIDTDRCRSN
jgi:hypothetical protein